MRVKTEFRVSRRDLPASAYGLISRMAPSAVRVDDLLVGAWDGETLKILKISAFAAICRAFGLKRTNLGDPGTYGFIRVRHHEPKDFEGCELLFVHGLK